MIHPIVYLPVELKHRELDSRLMTATHLLEAGVSVVLGQQWAMFENWRAWPTGVILFKTVNDIQARNMANFFAAGHVVAATDEEVLTFMRDFCIAFSPRAAENCHVFFAQSQLHKAAVVERFPGLADKIVVSGNPRIEMTSRAGRQAFQAQADKIRGEVGPFVLLNTNYATINSIWGELATVYRLVINAGLIKADDPNGPEIFKSWLVWEKRNRDELASFLAWSANNLRSHKIVVRPHPAERPEYWQEFGNNHPNVMIVPKSHHMPWIMASDLLVHTSCTTGLEAVLLEKPALNIEPYPDPAGERITSVVNPTFTSVNDAIPAAYSFLNAGGGPIADKAKYAVALEQYFPNYHVGGAAEAIAHECLNHLIAGNAALGTRFDWSSLGETYRRRERDALQKDKLTATKAEIFDLFVAIRQRIGTTRPVNLSVIDDSLFLLEPTS